MKPPEVEKIWELIPMTSPFMLKSGPPGVTGVDGNVGLDERNELFVGKVTAFSGNNPRGDRIVQPEGAPIAATHSPTLTSSDFPSFTTGRFCLQS